MSKKYDTFAAYLEDVYYNQIFSKIKSYLFNNKGRLDLSTSVVPDPSYVELSDFKIMGVNFHESDTDRIECKVTVRAEIETSGRGRRDYESDSTECWISIPLSATLRNGLQQVSIGYASEYSRELFRAEDALTKYLVPYIYAKDLDKHAERFLEKYCPRALEEPMPLPIKEIVENMGLTVYHAPLPDGIFGRTYFNDANVEVFTNKTCSETEDRTICPGTILVNPDVVFMRNIGSTNNTVIHECVHWDKHYKFFELQKLLNPDIQAISCAVVEDCKKKSNKLEDELSWMEWQANALAPKILIPAKTGKEKLSEILNRLHRAYRGRLRDGYVMELAISEFADFFKVSTTAAKIRAVELGFEQAAGVFNFVDGKNYPPFSFKKGSLKKGQTFVIDRNNVIIQSLLNPDLSEDIAARRFIHAGGLLVINDPQYVSIVEDSEPTLTEYALEHVDECCLVFDRTTRVSTQYDDSFYRIFVSIAAHVRRLRSAHQTVNFVQRVHDLGEQQRRRQLENGIVHVLGIGAVFIAVQILDEGEYRFLHNGIHLRGREVVEHAPLELAAIHGALTDLYLIGEDALIRQTQHGRLLCPAVVGIVKIVDEHQIGDLLDHIQRVDKAARRENVPKTVDFGFQLTGDHFFFSLAFCIVNYQAIYAFILYFDSHRKANKQLVCFSLARQNSSRRREMRIISRGW